MSVSRTSSTIKGDAPKVVAGGRGGSVAEADFFVLRSPLLPFDSFVSWGQLSARADPGPISFEERVEGDRTAARDRLRQVFDQPELQEALFLASPGLFDSYPCWREQPLSERGQKVERALVRYFARLCTRPTPFGLFAGLTTGRIGVHNRLELGPRSAYQRHSRLDADYLSGLTGVLLQVPAIRNQALFSPNSSLYRSGGRLRYAETRLAGDNRSHHLVSVQPDEALEIVLQAAVEGRTAAQIADRLVAGDPDIPLADARQFVDEVIQAQLLVSDLEPAATGMSPLPALLERLQPIPEAAPFVEVLSRVQGRLAALDAAPIGSSPAIYREVASDLASLSGDVDSRHLVQVDMMKPGPEVSLSQALLEELGEAVSVMHRLTRPSQAHGLARFRERFYQRYGDGEIPLSEALDEESGIGFSAGSAGAAHTSPLLHGLEVVPVPAGAADDAWDSRWAFLMKRVSETLGNGQVALHLDEDDLKKLEVAHPLPLPEAFVTMASVAAASAEELQRGQYQIELQGIGGPSGAYLFGRFCHADPALLAQVEAHLRREEARHPEAVYAEVVHLPEGRSGNVICRPQLRAYEIPFLGRSGAPADKQIPVADLLVSIRGDRIVLRSARLGCEVIPRLTNAHNFQSRRSLGTYQFLCLLQSQGVTQFRWDWGPLESLPFLPRVTVGKVVFSLAHWWLDQPEIQQLARAETPAARLRLVQELRRARNLPRLVAASDGDEKLTIDLDNSLSVDSLVHLIKDAPRAVLFEQFPAATDMIAAGPEGRFVHQLNIPMTTAMTTRPAATANQGTTTPPAVLPPRVIRFTPGTEWLYAKLYAGTATADEVLRSVVAPVAERAVARGAADRWFFLRLPTPTGTSACASTAIPPDCWARYCPTCTRR